MKQQNLLIGLVVILIAGMSYVGYQRSTDDINTQEVLRQELSGVVESISGLNLQLSGLKNERIDLEKQQTNLKLSGNELREKIKELEIKKQGLDMIINPIKEIKPDPMKELEKELNLPPVQKASFIPKVSAAYNGNDEYSKVRGQIIKIGVDTGVAEQIVYECYRQTKDGKLCVKNLIGVSNSESSILERCSKNNCFGVMVRNGDKYSLKGYENIKYGIEDWVKLYQKLGRYKRTTAQSRLNGNYCTSECKFWVGNYNDAVDKLDI